MKSFIVFVCVRIFKFHSLNKFKLYNTVLSTIVTMKDPQSFLILKLNICALLPSLSISQPWQSLFQSLFLCFRLLKFILFYFKIPHINDTMQYFSFSVWLLSLNITVKIKWEWNCFEICLTNVTIVIESTKIEIWLFSSRVSNAIQIVYLV